MRLMAVAGASACALALAGCRTNQDRCREIVDQLCERIHECETDQAKADPLWQARFGTSVDDCKFELYANPLQSAVPPQQGIACAEANTVQKLCSNLGETFGRNFDDAKAEECREARAAMSCADYLAQFSDPLTVPPACGDRCSQ
jgi:hypothetical protein